MATDMNDSVQVIHRPDHRRFETVADGAPSVAEYRLSDGVMHMTHTEVSPSHQGQGIAAALVEAALAHARRNDLKVDPLCPYVASYMQRHRQHADLLAAPGAG